MYSLIFYKLIRLKNLVNVLAALIIFQIHASDTLSFAIIGFQDHQYVFVFGLWFDRYSGSL
jgi:hypothetical protein